MNRIFSILLLIFLVTFNQKAHSNIDSLKTLLNKANGEQKVVLCRKICSNYIGNSDDSALHYANIGLGLARKLEIKTQEGYILINIGNVFLGKGNFDKSLENYIAADKLFQLVKDQKGMILASMDMGLVFDEQNLFDKALEQYDKALILSKKSGDKKSYADCLNLLGSLFYSKDNFKSLKYYEEALEIFRFINDINGIMDCLNNTAVIYQEQGNFENALINLKAYLNYSKSIDDPTRIVAAYHNIGLVYKDKKEHQNAISYLDSCALLAIKIKDFDDLRETYSTMYEIYKEGHKLEKALQYFELSVRAKDSLLSQTQKNTIIEMSTKYDTEKKETENKLLNQQIELKKRRIVEEQKNRELAKMRRSAVEQAAKKKRELMHARSLGRGAQAGWSYPLPGAGKSAYDNPGAISLGDQKKRKLLRAAKPAERREEEHGFGQGVIHGMEH